MRRILVAMLSLFLLTGCGAITNISRSVQSLETNRVPVEGTDEANRMHDLLAARPDAAAATTVMNSLVAETTDPIGAIVGGTFSRFPEKGLPSSHCDSPYGGLTKVQQFRVESTWVAPGTLTPDARERIRAAVRAAGAKHGVHKENVVSDNTIILDEGRSHPVQQFMMTVSFWDDTQEYPVRTTTNLTVQSGCVRD